MVPEVERFMSGKTAFQIGLLHDFATLRTGRLCYDCDDPKPEQVTLTIEKTEIQLFVEITINRITTFFSVARRQRTFKITMV